MSASPPTAIDAARIEALAAKLEVPPRMLLALAAHLLADAPSRSDAARIVERIERLRDAGAAGDAAIERLLLGPAALEAGNLNHALATVWSDHFADPV